MEAALVIFAVLALLSAVALPRRFQTSVSALAFVGMYLALILACVFADRLMYCAYGCLIVICALLTSQMSFSFFDKLGRSGQSRNEYIAVVMMSAAGLILFGNTDNMMVAFVALECATICLYIMAAFSKDCASSLEAGVKYLIVGGFSGALMLMGIAFMYGAGRIEGVDFMYMGNFSAGLLNGFFKTGLVLVFAGVFFKIAAFPFQFWAPDVYQGAPTPSSAFFAVASKIAGVVFLAKICAYLNFNSADLLSVKEDVVLTLSVIAGATIIVGNLGGITQMRTKRLLAFSVASGRISTFEPLSKHYEFIARGLGMSLTNIRRGEAVYFANLKHNSKRVKKIFDSVEKLGREIALGEVSDDTVASIELPIAPSDEAFFARAKIYWNILRS